MFQVIDYIEKHGMTGGIFYILLLSFRRTEKRKERNGGESLQQTVKLLF